MSLNSLNSLSSAIKAEARRLGFYACGVAKAESVESDWAEHYLNMVDSGSYGTMGYMANNIDKRLDPRLLVDGVRSIVVVAMSYAPSRKLPESSYQIAAYAYGKDYHDVLKARLRELAASISELSSSPSDKWRVFVDTAPVLERYWAVKAGLGWIGKNSQLIIPRAGSMFFLGEVFVDIDLAYDTPIHSHCGNCLRCVDACPSGAIGMPKGNLPTFDARRCLSYLTIENRDEIPSEYMSKMGDCFYGCDRCQQACPYNKFAIPTDEPLFQPSPELLAMTKDDWDNLTVEKYRLLFKGSAVKRAKYEGLVRNIECVKETSK